MDEDPSVEIQSKLLKLIPEVYREDLDGMVRRLPGSGGFQRFFDASSNSLRKAFRNQGSVEDCKDLLCEVEFAAYLARFVSKIDYQIATPSKKNIDFILTFNGTDQVGVEVKRIREVPTPTIPGDDGLEEVNYDQRESFKFTDCIMAATRQLMPTLPNVVFIKVDSTTHEEYDAGFAVNQIVKHVQDNRTDFFRKHKFESRDHFLEHYRRMTLLVVRSRWSARHTESGISLNPNNVWINEDAGCSLAKSLIDIFRRGDNWR